MSILSAEAPRATVVGLPPHKQYLVRNLAKEVRKSELAELDKYRMREDFLGLHSDIVHELEAKAEDRIADFYELSEVLNEIAMLLTPEAAYIYGRQAREAGTDSAEGFIAFMREVIAISDKSGLSQKRDRLFHILCEILGDTRSLMTEYIELHGRVNVEQYQVHRFYELGYTDTGTPSILERDTKKKQWEQPPQSRTVAEKQLSEAIDSRHIVSVCPTQA